MQEEPPAALRVIAWGFAVFFTVCCALGAVRAVQKGLTSSTLLDGLLWPVMFLSWALVSVAFATSGWANLVRQSRLRNAAKGYWHPGESIVVPLVEPQPVADADVLALPLTIRTRPRWQMCIVLALLLLPVFVGIFGIFVLEGAVGGSPEALAILFAASIFGVLVYAGTVVAIATTAFTRLEVSEEGMSLRKWDIRQEVAWDDNELFALIVGSKHSPAVLGFELSGSQGAIRWQQRLRPTWYAFSTPEQPFEVYDQQMRALLQLIVARTSLPLYDLR